MKLFFYAHQQIVCVAALSGCVREGKVTNILLLLSLITTLVLHVIVVDEELETGANINSTPHLGQRSE